MRANLSHIEETARNIRTFWFDPVKPIDYIAGQFIDLSFPDKQALGKHWFTLSSSPTEEMLGITTKILPEKMSDYKNHLNQLKAGDEVEISQPMGDFVLPKDPTIPLVFVAISVGITPIRSIVKWLNDEQQRRSIHLIYVSKNIDEVAFRDLFNEYGLPTDIILRDPPRRWKGKTGLLTADRILEIAPDIDSKHYYVSGPEITVETLVNEFKDTEVSSERLITDYFPGYPAL